MLGSQAGPSSLASVQWTLPFQTSGFDVEATWSVSLAASKFLDSCWQLGVLGSWLRNGSAGDRCAVIRNIHSEKAKVGPEHPFVRQPAIT